MNEKSEDRSQKSEGSSQRFEGAAEEAELATIDARLEGVVRGTIGRELDVQRGRAGAAFRQALADSTFRMGNAGISAADSGTKESEGERALRRLKWWAGAASALAAALAVVVTLQFWMRPNDAPKVEAQPVAVSAPPSVDQITFTRDVDGGTVVLDDATPLRVVRQQTVHKTQWFDPAENATFSVTEPVERVGYVRLRPD